MSCPNCGKHFKTLEYDNQTILHCHNCGCSFFEQNGINRITLKTARTLSWDKKESFIKGEELACPKDGAIMISVQNEDAIPLTVTLLRCPNCYGVFAHPEDLVNFKRAQNVKLRFFKIWSKPLPSLQTVLVLGFIGFFILSIALSLNNLNNKQLTTTSAQDRIFAVYAKQSGDFIFFSFKTAQAARTAVRFIDKQTNETVTKQVSNTFTTLHMVTIKELNAQHPISYQIMLEYEHGDKYTSEEKILPL